MNSTKFCANLRKNRDGDPGNDYTSTRGRKHEPYTGSTNSTRPKMVRQVKSKVKSMLIIFFGIKGLLTKNSSWQAKQSISHNTVTIYGDCMKMCEDFAPNFGEKRTGCFMATHRGTLPFSPKNF
jgi:hypothetical protein